VVTMANNDDGIQIEEADAGNLSAILFHVESTNNDGFGVNVEQAGDGIGSLILKDETLDSNGDGELDAEGVVVKPV
jgi:hypothetical protein